MYILKTEQSFDSAHFLAGYEGKCRNLHGHRWKIEAEVWADELHKTGQLKGMVAEEGTLKPETAKALESENFRIIWVPFRPTAENFAKHFYNMLKEKGYQVYGVSVYETPNNCARYWE